MPWIDQVCEGVRHAVQNGIENLSGSNVSANAHPEDGYRFRARTAEELKQSVQLVAPVGGVHMPRPPVQADDGTYVPPPDEIEAAAGVRSSKITVPGQAPPPSAPQKGWIL